MASRSLLSTAKLTGFVAVGQLNSLRFPQLLSASFIKSASYVTCLKNRSSASDPRTESVKTNLVANKYGVRNFSLQNWLGIRAKELTKENMKDYADVGCPICRRNVTFTFKDVLFLSQFMSPKGYVLNRRVTGVCRKQQKKLEKAIRLSQRLGLLPKVSPILVRELEAKKQQQKQNN